MSKSVQAGASIITGGTRGIGRAVTLRLAREGPVIVVARSKEDLEKLTADVTATGGTIKTWIGDVAEPNVATRVRELAEFEGWPIKNLICNAGFSYGGPTEEFSPDKWRITFDVNVHGSFYFVRECLPNMLKQGYGNILFMSSIAGLRGYKYEAAYSASKHALVGLARVLAQEYGKRGIVAIPICPSFVDTESTRRTVKSLAKRRKVEVAEAEQLLAASNPQRRLIRVEEISEIVAQLCAGHFQSLSGNPLILSGGE